jgi:hypothetical protein
MLGAAAAEGVPVSRFTGEDAGMGRRRFLQITAAAGLAGSAVMLDPVPFAGPAAAVGTDPSTGTGTGIGTGEETRVVTGRLEPGVPDWVYLPVQLPDGVREIAVVYSYDRPTPPAGVAGNALDIGIFDQNGHQLGNTAGFRGWSGGFRDSFAISRSGATPGYLAGPIRAGRWHIILGPYTVAPQGLNYQVQITLRYGEPGPAFVLNPAPHRATGRGRAWYRGDMHLHTVHSDGRRVPEELAAGARAAGLDFIVSTEHNTSSASRIWGDHAGPDLLIIDGEEITTRNGHYLAVGLPAGAWIDWRYRAPDGSFEHFAGQIHRLGGLVVGAHPYCPFVGCSWKFGYGRLDGVEVWNGPWTADDEVSVQTWDGMLVEDGRSGRWLPAVGNSDAHREPQVIGLPQNVVLAGGLDRRSILDGVRAGRLWVAESAAVDMSFQATSGGRTAGIGERLPVPDGALVTVEVTAKAVPGCAVRLYTDEGKVLDQPLPADDAGTVSWTTTPQVSGYVRAEIRRPDPTFGPLGAMVALTNPIFLGRTSSDR